MKTLQNKDDSAINERRAECLQHIDPSNHSDPDKEDRAMAIEANIRTCGDSASERTANTWKSIGELARRLAESAGGDK